MSSLQKKVTRPPNSERKTRSTSKTQKKRVFLQRILTREWMLKKWQEMAKKKSRKELIYTVTTIHKMDKCFTEFSIYRKGIYFDRWFIHFKWRKLIKGILLKRRIQYVKEEYKNSSARLWEQLTKPLIKEIHCDRFYDALQDKNNNLYLFNYFHAWNNQIHSLKNFHQEMYKKWHYFATKYRECLH